MGWMIVVIVVVVLVVVLLLKKSSPFVVLVLAMGQLLERWLGIQVEWERGDPDRWPVVVAEGQVVMVCRTVWMVTSVKLAACESIRLATFFRAVQACLLY